MKSDIIHLDNHSHGFREAVEQTALVAAYKKLSPQNTRRLQILAEEMLSMLRSVTGEVEASFWLEVEDDVFTLGVSTKTQMDKEKRYLLISSSSARKNSAANGFLGMLRDAFEEALTADAERTYFELPADPSRSGLSGKAVDNDDWDGYERSILLKLADDVKIFIKGGNVTMTVKKRFAP